MKNGRREEIGAIIKFLVFSFFPENSFGKAGETGWGWDQEEQVTAKTLSQNQLLRTLLPPCKITHLLQK